MKFERTEVWGFEHAIRGMRNPMNSWDKSDSDWEFVEDPSIINPNDQVLFVMGDNDLALAQKLIRAGSEHRKFMRQIFVSVDITAPLYWWKEFDTYKVGTVANSTSTMHKLASTPITKECFEMDDYESIIVEKGEFVYEVDSVWYELIKTLEDMRQVYNSTRSEDVWKELIRLLPESWLQKRTVTMNYENLLAMCSRGQRRFHKLNEWSGMYNHTKTNFISWARTLPYAQELIFIDEEEE